MIDRIYVLVIGLLVLANFVLALAATVNWRRTYYAARAAYRSMTPEDWKIIKAGADLLTVAVGLAAML